MFKLLLILYIVKMYAQINNYKSVFFRVFQKCPFLVTFFIGYYGYCFIKFVNSIDFTRFKKDEILQIFLSHNLSLYQTQEIEA